MDNTKIKLLIVEDDLLVRTSLEIVINEMGHEIVASVDNAVDAIFEFSSKSPDLVICDISLKDKVNGIELVRKLNALRRCPIIFLTAFHSDEMFSQAKKVAPIAFIQKPLEKQTIQRSIELAVEHSMDNIGFVKSALPVENCLYTRVGNKLKKIAISEIESVQVDGKYCTLNVNGRSINCKISLKEIIEKLPKQEFVQVSRAAIINLNFIQDIELSSQLVRLPSAEIAIGRNYKEGLLSRLNFI
jgi:DNA-binding LytR/AlgR family response regulator